MSFLRFGEHRQTVSDYWKPLVRSSLQQELDEIYSLIVHDFTPSALNVLRFLNVLDVKVVILGQDPYSTPGAASGRAFEQSGASTWDQVTQTSLQNIVKVLYRDRKRTDHMPSIDDIRDAIADRRFRMLQPPDLFNWWEDQGVLLLNTALTTRERDPGAHTVLWACVTNKIIRHISRSSPKAYWFLWGKEAQYFKPLITTQGRILEADHPRLNDGNFLATTCFKATRGVVDWYGTRKPR